MSNLYDRLAGESDQAWQAFYTFRDMGVDRSLPQVAERCTKSTSLMKRWSAKYTWAERAKAWDSEQDRLRTDATNKAIAKATEKAVYQHEITQQKVLQETGNLAFARITDVIQWENEEGLVDSKDLPDNVAASIESVEFSVTEEGKRYVKKVKFHGKQPALTKLGENQKLWGKDGGIQSPTANFFQFFLEAGRSGEIEREMKRRGLLPLAPGEVIPPPPTDDPIEIDAVREE